MDHLPSMPVGTAHNPEQSKMLPGAAYVRWGYILIVGAFVVYAAYNISPFVVLAPYIAFLANPTVEVWAKRFNSRPKAVTLMLGGLFGVVVSISIVVLLLGIALTTVVHQFPDLVKVYLPQAQKLLDDLESQLRAYDIFGKDFDVALSSLVQVISRMFTEGGSALPKILGYLLAPLVLVAEGLIVLVLVGFFLGYWPETWRGLENQAKTYVPSAWPWIHEIAGELQIVGRAVAWGYIVVVCILTPIVFVSLFVLSVIYAAATGVSLVNLAIISLCFGVISAMPGVGTKAGLALIVLAGLILFGFSLQVSVVMTIIGLVITTLESKLLTPKLMGKALGLNAAIILTVALTSILLGGVSGALWTMFVGLPVVVAVNTVYSRTSKKLELAAQA
ncbi:MAG: AI-2E family transporter [Alphaproteobacteria bacterium]|nr:MAG: AI-2E family transporter [Alphaproteobacteria bacterium]